MKLALFIGFACLTAAAQTDPPLRPDPITHDFPNLFTTGGVMNGHAWGQWSYVQKVVYIEGVEDGFLFSAEDGHPVSVPNLTFGETADRIDLIYGNKGYQNLSIAAIVALLYRQQALGWTADQAKKTFDHFAELSNAEHVITLKH